MNMGTLTHPAADPTEAFRRRRLAEVNVGADRAELERRHGQVWDLRELAAQFVLIGFAAPYVIVRRKADGAVGSLEFQHQPRFYFNWQEDR
jgi:hypothetical protein